MASLFGFDSLHRPLDRHAERSELLKSLSTRLLEKALFRGEFDRGNAARITGVRERAARRALNEVVDAGLLASATPKGCT